MRRNNRILESTVDQITINGTTFKPGDVIVLELSEIKHIAYIFTIANITNRNINFLDEEYQYEHISGANNKIFHYDSKYKTKRLIRTDFKELRDYR